MQITTAATAPIYVKAGGQRKFIEQLLQERWGVRPNFAIQGQLTAMINRSRWVVICPTCDGGMFVDPADPIFYCPDCCNQGNGGAAGKPGKAYRVIFPPEIVRHGIETALLKRPDPRTRNWFPHETVADLIAENIAHGAE